MLAGTAAALMIGVFAGCSQIASPTPSPSASPTPTATPSESVTPPSTSPGLSKDDIQKVLDAGGDKIIDVRWSPDNTMVAYIKSDDSTGNVFVWKVDTEEPQLVAPAEGTTDGFSWAPDSKHFLIEVGHMGPGTVTATLVDSDTLKILDDSIVTVNTSPPIWSPDGQALALSIDDESSGTIQILRYDLSTQKKLSLLESTNTKGPYVVEKWLDKVITYTEMSSTGERVEHTLQIAD